MLGMGGRKVEGVSPKRLRTCRRLLKLSVSAYAVSLVLPAIRGDGPDVWTGFGCLAALVTSAPGFCFGIMHPATWANLTLFLAWYELRQGDADRAAAMGIGTVALGASFWFLLLVGITLASEVLVGYWVWLGSMLVVVAAPFFVRADPVTVGGEPSGGDRAEPG
jgi:hypothetical protein